MGEPPRLDYKGRLLRNAIIDIYTRIVENVYPDFTLPYLYN